MASIRPAGPGGEAPYKVTVKRNGERWYFTRDTLAEAQKVAGHAETDLDHGVDPYARYDVPKVRPSGSTLRQWSVTWLAAQDVEESSRAKMQGHLDRDVLPAFGDAVLDVGISRITVQSWLTGLSRKRRERTDEPLSPSSVGNIWAVMAPMCAAAVAEGLMERDPCAGLKAPKVPSRREKRHALTAAQVVALAEEIARPKPRKKVEPRTTAVQRRWAVLTLALAWSGCRWSELGGLRRDPREVNMLARPAYLVVTEPIKTTGKRGGRYHGDPKSEAGRRRIQLTQAVADLLAAHMAHGYPYVFGTRLGTAHHYEEYRLAFKAAAKRLGHPEWTVHDLRHTHATWLRACPRVAVQERLGHESKDVTDGYTHVPDEDRAEVLRVLGAEWVAGHAAPRLVRRRSAGRP